MAAMRFDRCEPVIKRQISFDGHEDFGRFQIEKSGFLVQEFLEIIRAADRLPVLQLAPAHDVDVARGIPRETALQKHPVDQTWLLADKDANFFHCLNGLQRVFALSHLEDYGDSDLFGLRTGTKSVSIR